MAHFNALHQETVHFDEEVKGDHLLITSQIISYRGTTICTHSVNEFTKISYTQSVNGIPTKAEFQIIVTSPDAEIKVDFARGLWFGNKQFNRVCTVMSEVAGRRLVLDALTRLQGGETLIWRHNLRFERKSIIKLSRLGINIDQTGLIHKKLSIEWPVLNFTQLNGSSKFKNYKTKERAAIRTWHMRDNMTFLGVVGFLVDNANYRMLQASPARS